MDGLGYVGGEVDGWTCECMVVFGGTSSGGRRGGVNAATAICVRARGKIRETGDDGGWTTRKRGDVDVG